VEDRRTTKGQIKRSIKKGEVEVDGDEKKFWEGEMGSVSNSGKRLGKK